MVPYKIKQTRLTFFGKIFVLSWPSVTCKQMYAMNDHRLCFLFLDLARSKLNKMVYLGLLADGFPYTTSYFGSILFKILKF